MIFSLTILQQELLSTRKILNQFGWLVEFVVLPLSGIVDDVICDGLQRCVVADVVFIIVALPQFTVERRPSQLFYPTDVFVCEHGFEPWHHRGLW